MSMTDADKEFLEQERALFESLFTRPSFCIWTGVGFAAQDYNAWSAHEYADKWKGWIERAKLLNTLPVPVQTAPEQRETEPGADIAATSTTIADAAPDLVKEVEGLEPIYQYKCGDGSWIDQTKASYDYNVKHGIAEVRIVYTQSALRESRAQLLKDVANIMKLVESYASDKMSEERNGDYGPLCMSHRTRDEIRAAITTLKQLQQAQEPAVENMIEAFKLCRKGGREFDYFESGYRSAFRDFFAP